MEVDRAHTEENVEEEDQEIPGGEILLLRWRQRVIDGKIWNVCHKIEQGGGLSSVAYAPPRCNRHKQVSNSFMSHPGSEENVFSYFFGRGFARALCVYKLQLDNTMKDFIEEILSNLKFAEDVETKSLNISELLKSAIYIVFN